MTGQQVNTVIAISTSYGVVTHAGRCSRHYTCPPSTTWPTSKKPRIGRRQQRGADLSPDFVRLNIKWPKADRKYARHAWISFVRIPDGGRQQHPFKVPQEGMKKPSTCLYVCKKPVKDDHHTVKNFCINPHHNLKPKGASSDGPSLCKFRDYDCAPTRNRQRVSPVQ